MAFWLIAAGMSLVVVLALLLPLLRAAVRPAEALDDEGTPDMQIYRDQMAEIDGDVARGILSADEAERIRTEVARRLLEADRKLRNRRRPGRASPLASGIIALVATLVVVGGAFGLYRVIGRPGMSDLPLARRDAILAAEQANRPTQEEVEARLGPDEKMRKGLDPKYLALVAQLRKTVAKRPNDLRGQQLLTQHEARLGNFAAARKAKQRVIEIKGDAATANDYTDLAELMIVAAGGYVSPKAERALATAVKLDNTNPRARYYSGLDFLQNGRPDLTYDLWAGLLEQGPPEAPWIAPIKSQIAEVARLAGRPVPALGSSGEGPQAAPPLAGPTPAQVQAAGKMSAADRQKFIRSMVGRLSRRLESQGGSAAEWARLIRAYGVLGEQDKARDALRRATAAHGSDAAAMEQIRAAAQGAGIGG